MKKFVSVFLIAAMFFSMLAVTASALTVDDDIASKWNPMAIKFSSQTKKPIMTTIDSKKVIKTDGYEFKTNSNGGIDMGFHLMKFSREALVLRL